MSRQNNAAPVIIKRKKLVASTGHHGGAWKVAYADFVTAMMAFFLMMWLLGATTETQRKGLADYFNPSIPLNRFSSGGDRMFGGNDLQAQERQGPETSHDTARQPGDNERVDADSFAEIEQLLDGLGGESAVMIQALRHVITRQTDAGLVIELHDLPGQPLFDADSDTPMPVLHVLAPALAEVFALVANGIAVEGHVRAYTLVRREDPRWSLSLARAARLRLLLEAAGLDPARVHRVTGHADRRPVHPNPMAAGNNRIELILLRRDPHAVSR